MAVLGCLRDPTQPSPGSSAPPWIAAVRAHFIRGLRAGGVLCLQEKYDPKKMDVLRKMSVQMLSRIVSRGVGRRLLLVAFG